MRGWGDNLSGLNRLRRRGGLDRTDPALRVRPVFAAPTWAVALVVSRWFVTTDAVPTRPSFRT